MEKGNVGGNCILKRLGSETKASTTQAEPTLCPFGEAISSSDVETGPPIPEKSNQFLHTCLL